MKIRSIKTGVLVTVCILFISTVMILGSRKVSYVTKITGCVKEMDKNSILLDDDSSAGYIDLAYSQSSGDLDLQVGDRIEIEFIGTILETSPARIADKNGVRITKIGEGEIKK